MQMQVIIDRFLQSEKSHIYKLSSKEKLLLFVLASKMGNKPTCWYSYSSLSVMCSMSKSTLIRAIKSLEQKKILLVKREENCNNVYQFYPQVVSV